MCIFFTEVTERKRSERELRKSKERLQAAVDAADRGLWDWDLSSGEIVWLGHHDKLFGFADGEFDGSYGSFETRVHPDDLEALNQAVARARADRSEYSHEYRVVWPDGSLHWMNGIGRFVYDESTSNRAVAVHSGAIVHVLRTLYGAGALADELDPPTAGR